ncbi:MAG: hypothetical protein KF862_14720 [Chitinophagaceae bacterium]|nr:hypothetical protein [Chitinophagaceae bacterium]
MKYGLTSLIHLCLFLNTQGQTSNSDLNYYNLKGNVQKTSETWFNYNTNSWTQGDVFTFDNDGNITQITEYYDNVVSGYQERFYDAKGNEIERKIFRDGKIDYHSYYTYDSLSQIIKSIRFDSDNKQYDMTIYVRNKKGKKLADYYYGVKDEFLNKGVYTYNSKGDLIETKFYDKDSLIIRTDSIQYTYNSAKEIITKVMYYTNLTETYNYENGKLVRKIENQPSNNLFEGGRLIETTYNSYGDIVQEKGYYGTPTQEDKMDTKYEYEYDLEGNWIKQNKFHSKDGSRDGYRKRTITYY